MRREMRVNFIRMVYYKEGGGGGLLAKSADTV